MKYWGYFVVKLIAVLAFAYGTGKLLYVFFPKEISRFSLQPFMHDLPYTLMVMAHFLVCAGLVFLSLTFTREAGRVASIWPLNALLLAALLQPNALSWRQVLGVGGLANFSVDLLMGDGALSAALLMAANLIEVGICFLLLRTTTGPFDITQGPHLRRFIAVAVLAPIASALIAAVTLAPSAPLLGTFGMWFAADALGLLMFTPALLAVAKTPGHLALPKRHAMELVLSVAALAAVSTIVFAQDQYPLLFLVLPALTLATFRFGIAGAASGVLLVSVFAIAFAVAGHGPIQLIDGGDTQKIIVLQIFLALMSLTTLPIAAALAHAERARVDLRARAKRRSAPKKPLSRVKFAIEPWLTIRQISWCGSTTRASFRTLRRPPIEYWAWRRSTSSGGPPLSSLLRKTGPTRALFLRDSSPGRNRIAQYAGNSASGDPTARRFGSKETPACCAITPVSL